MKLSDLRGQFVRLVFGGASATPSSANTMNGDGVTLVLVAPHAGTNGLDACIARDETIPLATAILSGVKPDQMAGMQVLVDPDGWLRAVQPTGAAASWNDPDKLAAEIMMLRKHKIADVDGAGETMKMPMDMPM